MTDNQRVPNAIAPPTRAAPKGLQQAGAPRPLLLDRRACPKSVIGLGVLLLFTLATRLIELDHASFCHPEAWRANWMREGGMQEARRFPPALFALGNAAQRLMGRNEGYLRFPYAVAGVLVVVAVYLACRRTLGEATGLIAASLCAVHPVLVYYSRKQLEYSFEACMTALVFVVGYRFCQMQAKGAVLRWLALAVLAMMFSFTGVLSVWAWLILWIVMQCLRSHESHDFLAHLRPSNRAELLTGRCECETQLGTHRANEAPHSARVKAWRDAVLPLVVVAAITACWFLWIRGGTAAPWIWEYFEKTEPVWPGDRSLASIVSWTWRAWVGAGWYVAGGADIWAPLNYVLSTLYAVCALAGISVLWRRYRLIVLAMALVLFAATLSGALRLWPFGAIRHSTFLIPLAMIVVGAGLARFVSDRKHRLVAVGLVGSLIVLPAARATRSSILEPAAYEHIRPAIGHVIHRQSPVDGVFAYYFSKDALLFYAPAFGCPVLLQPDEDRGDDSAFLTRFSTFAEGKNRVWFLVSHDWRGEQDRWVGLLAERFTLLEARRWNDAAVFLFDIAAR